MSQRIEPEDHIYVASFRMMLMSDKGERFHVNPRILCPASQFHFYALIGRMLDSKLIDRMTHLTAERTMFEQGHLPVA